MKAQLKSRTVLANGAANNILITNWEKIGQQKLIETLTTLDLKILNKTQKRIKRTLEVKKQLAQNLILRYGRDLLCEKEVRNLIGKRYGIKNKDIPARWHPGSSAVQKFVDIIEFPAEFAGIKEDLKKPDYEFFRKEPIRELQDFQKEIVGRSLEELAVKGNRLMISMPTGSGKTITAIRGVLNYIMSLEDKEANNIIWLAHTEELCEQAYNSFKNELERRNDNKKGVYLFRFWKKYLESNIDNLLSIGADENLPFIVICTPLKTYNFVYNNPDLESLLSNKTSLIIIDEAHRTGAETYRNIINMFSKNNNSISFIGLTATPYRKEYNNKEPELETKSLTDIFNKNLIIPKKTLGDNLIKIKTELQNRGYLSKPIKVCIDMDEKMPINLAECTHTENFIKIDRELQKFVDKDQRRKKILHFIQKQHFNRESKVLYFGPSKRDVREMSIMLRKVGYLANYITSETRLSTRRKIIEDFSLGKIQFLCNCEILTTGFDEPKIDHVIMARPTVSQVLYEQMIGRGLRGEKFGGTKTCKILVCEDIKFPAGYEFYQFWKDVESIKTETWSFETLLVRSLVFMIYKDGHVKEEEVKELEEIYSSVMKKNPEDGVIQEEIYSIGEWMDDYDEQLYSLSQKLTDEEKDIIIKSCKRVSECDGHIHEKESSFLHSICSVLGFS